MVEFKLAIGDKKSKKTYKTTISGPDAEKLVGKKIGEMFRGEIISLNGYELEITGGSDKTGVPMRKDVSGQTRKKVLLTKGVGFHAKSSGQRKRKSIRGNTISNDTAQVNCKVIKTGKEDLAKVLGGEAKPAEGEEKPAEEPKQEEKTEEPAKEEESTEEEKKDEA